MDIPRWAGAIVKGKLEQVTLEAGRKAYGPYAEAFRELVDGLEEFAAKEFRGEAE